MSDVAINVWMKIIEEKIHFPVSITLHSVHNFVTTDFSIKIFLFFPTRFSKFLDKVKNHSSAEAEKLLTATKPMPDGNSATKAMEMERVVEQSNLNPFGNTHINENYIDFGVH